MYYDFQAVGEFVVATSTTDSLEIQVRQTAFPGLSDVSVNRAVAMNVDGDRVGVYSENSGLTLHLNGAPTTFRAGDTQLPRGGRVTYSATDSSLSYSIAWPDGSKVWVEPVGRWGLKMEVRLNPARRGQIAGLLGNFDENPSNDLVTRQGTALPSPPPFEELYKKFGNSWRISQAESLFDYQRGQTTTTFTGPKFPAKPVSPKDVPNRGDAEALCRRAGVNKSELLANCILDVGLTGQPVFARSTAELQSFFSNGTPSSTGTAISEPGGTLRDGGVADHAIIRANEVDTYQLELGDATVFRLVDVTGEIGNSGNGTLGIEVDGPDASGSPGFTITSNYQYVVKRGATYTLKVSRGNGDTGRYGFRLVTAKERRIPAKLGDTVTGQLDVPGRIDLYAIQAIQHGKLYLADGTGCAFSTAVVDDVPAPRVYTPFTPCTQITLATLELGKHYLLIVWSSESKTGDYSFRLAITQ